MFRLKHVPAVRLEEDEHQHVAMFADGGFLHFVWFDPTDPDLRMRSHMRAPGSVADPNGERDYVTDGPERGTLWRARLQKDYRDLLDRMTTHDLVEIVNTEDT